MHLTTIRPVSYYVRRVRTLDYWRASDETMVNEFNRGHFLLLLDRHPLIRVKKTEPTMLSLAIQPFDVLKKRLNQYGLQFDAKDSALLDVVAPQGGNYHDNDSGDDWAPLFSLSLKTLKPTDDQMKTAVDKLKSELAASFEAKFLDTRLAILSLPSVDQRNLLAKAQALHRWAAIYRRCPKCGYPLVMKLSKSSASCDDCEQIFYPTFSPVAICLVVDASNEFCLLVRHRRSVHGVYTAVAGFSEVGESLEETVRREIAEELGIDSIDIRYSGMSQPWPFPNSSMMCAFTAVAERSDKVDVAVDELECAQWFTKTEVREALERTIGDPFLRNLKRDPQYKQIFQYVPPQGAIAHHLIRNWVYGDTVRR